MWRFAVITRHPTNLILRKIPICQGLKQQSSISRLMSNDVLAQQIEKEQPIRELFSLEDFGLLTTTRSSSFDSFSSFENDQTFIDQLLRYDTLSNIQIPTTVDSKELGGSNEVFGFDQALELLAEGVDAELIADELSAGNVEEAETSSYHDEQQPSTSAASSKISYDEDSVEVENLPFLMPNLDNLGEVSSNIKTRKLLTEKIRRERKLNLSTTTRPEAESSQPDDDTIVSLFHTQEVLPNVGEMMFPTSLPMESYSSNWENVEKPLQSTEISESQGESEYQEELSLEVLEGIMTNGNLSELVNELKNAVWPTYLFTEDRNVVNRVNRIFRYIVHNSENIEEVEQIVERFAATHPLATIPDDVIIHIAAKSAKIGEKLESLAKLCVSREVRSSRNLVDESLKMLYEAVLKDGKKDSAKNMFSKCLKLNFERSADNFLKCYADNALKTKNSFESSFVEWKNISSKYGSSSGIESYWIMALDGEGGKDMSKRIASLLDHCLKYEHPFTTMAWLICGFVRLDKINKAIEVFKTVSVSGRHFRAPLMSFVEECDLESIERLGELIERGMIAEKRRGGRKGTDKSNETNETPSLLLDGMFYETLSKFYGTNGKKKKSSFNQKLKKKVHKVDDMQMHELCDNIQRGWIKCAVERKDQSSAERLLNWTQRNRIEMDPKVFDKINKLLDEK